MIKRIRKIFYLTEELGDIFRFLWKNRIWWLIPIFLISCLLAILFLATEGTIIAPFVYTLF
jgi:hypothetical protein